MKLRDANLQVYKKNSFIHPLSFMHFAFIFSECFTITSSEEDLCVSTISFRKYKGKVVLLVIYLFNYDSPKSTFFMLNMAFHIVLSTVLSNNLKFFVSCNTKITRTSFFWLCVLTCTFLKKLNCSGCSRS